MANSVLGENRVLSDMDLAGSRRFFLCDMEPRQRITFMISIAFPTFVTVSSC